MQAEHEKRWLKHTTRNEERWHEHERPHAELRNRLERLEDRHPEILLAIEQLRETHETLVKHLVEFGTSLAESRKSTLPNVSVPPATSPEDGRGIPEPRPRKRN
jgi:hypothetical protein